MTFYRTLLAAAAAIAIASPVFANDPVTQPSSSATVAAKSAAAAKVNVNKASAKELLKVQGLTAAKARAIVTYRKKHGEFKSLDDLVKVRSIGKLAAPEVKAIQDQLSLS